MRCKFSFINSLFRIPSIFRSQCINFKWILNKVFGFDFEVCVFPLIWFRSFSSLQNLFGFVVFFWFILLWVDSDRWVISFSMNEEAQRELSCKWETSFKARLDSVWPCQVGSEIVLRLSFKIVVLEELKERCYPSKSACRRYFEINRSVSFNCNSIMSFSWKLFSKNDSGNQPIIRVSCNIKL